MSNYDLSTCGGDSLMNTANCYIVNAPGTYSLPLVYGNAIKDGANNAPAYTSGVTAGQEHILYGFTNHRDTAIVNPYIYNNYGCVPASAALVWQDAEGLVSVNAVLGGISANPTLTFTVPATSICQGNAVVAVKNASNQVLWSWHIWVTDFDPDSSEGAPKSFVNATGYTYKFMPVNIGWCDGNEYSARSVKVRFTQNETGIQREINLNQLKGSETTGNSPYFQWGRKDPFVGILAKGGNKTWYDGSGVKKVNSPVIDSLAWVHGQIGNVIQNGILNPDTYCVKGNDRMDDYYYNLWSAKNTGTVATDFAVIKTVYDPSPVGYHMPASKAFTGFSMTAPSVWNETSKSWTFAKGDDTVNFPLVGYRHYYSSHPYKYGYNGYYWLATPYAHNSGYNMNISMELKVVAPMTFGVRACGFSVRCVKD